MMMFKQGTKVWFMQQRPVGAYYQPRSAQVESAITTSKPWRVYELLILRPEFVIEHVPVVEHWVFATEPECRKQCKESNKALRTNTERRHKTTSSPWQDLVIDIAEVAVEHFPNEPTPVLGCQLTSMFPKGPKPAHLGAVITPLANAVQTEINQFKQKDYKRK